MMTRPGKWDGASRDGEVCDSHGLGGKVRVSVRW